MIFISRNEKETEQEERTEWAIQAYTSVCSFRDGPECFHPDNKNQRWRCVFSNCPIKVTQTTESELLQGRVGRSFVMHIEKHLQPGQQVICKICGKTVSEIANEFLGGETQPTTEVAEPDKHESIHMLAARGPAGSSVHTSGNGETKPKIVQGATVIWT